MVDRKHKELAKEIGPSTANLAMRVLRIVWNYAADRSTLPECPGVASQEALVRSAAQNRLDALAVLQRVWGAFLKTLEHAANLCGVSLEHDDKVVLAHYFF